MRVDETGWLVAETGDPAVQRVPTVRTSALVVPKPLGVVWHWAAGRGGPGYAGALARSIAEYKPTDRAASWHMLLARDGTIWQSAPITVGTWHVGQPGRIGGTKFSNVNKATIGIETENAGQLKQVGSQWYCWPYFKQTLDQRGQTDPACLMPPERVVQAPAWVPLSAGAFDSFTAGQEVAAEAIVRALRAALGFDRAAFGYGHLMFDFPRKQDPGPLWLGPGGVIPRALDRVFGAAP